MCGINGIYAYRAARPVEADELVRTRDLMAARGPDGAGLWIAPDRAVGFGHRRLSLVDLSQTGAQPMASADGRLVVTFNGEIYNHRELRRELEAQGSVFAGTSDTEVILHLYRRLGLGMLDRLRGMFAFGLWDGQERRLLLARDPYGIKPLYVADHAGSLRFASSVKALVGSGALPRDPDPAGLVGFELFGSVPEPFTLYRSIACLPAGTYLLADRNGVGAPAAYASIAATLRAAEECPVRTDVQERVRASLLDSVRHHLVADVPIGAFLSAGVDSSTLVALMRDAGQQDIRTVTLAFEAFRGTPSDEAPEAEAMARRYGTRHVTRVVGRDEFLSDLPRIMACMDQPTIDGLNTWFVAKATRELGLKAAVSGIGGDELVGGYSTFARLPRLVRTLRRVPRLGAATRPVARLLGLLRGLGLPLHPKSAGLLAYGRDSASAYLLQRGVFLPFELDGPHGPFRDPAVVREGLERLRPLDLIASALRPLPRTAFGAVCALESSLYLRNQLLRDADWAGMAHGVEIRTPLVDAVVLAELAPVFAVDDPPSGKALLAGSPTRPLPDELVRRRKTGFQIPVQDLLLAPEKGRVADRLWSRDWMGTVRAWSAPAQTFEPRACDLQAFDRAAE